MDFFLLGPVTRIMTAVQDDPNVELVLDVVDLRNFYAQRMGVVARRRKQQPV